MLNGLSKSVFFFVTLISIFYQNKLYSAAEYAIPNTPRSCDLKKLKVIHKLLETSIIELSGKPSDAPLESYNKVIPERLFVAYLGYFIERLEFKIQRGDKLDQELPDFFPHIVGRQEDIHSYEFGVSMQKFLGDKLNRKIKKNYACEYFDISLNIFRHILGTEKQDDYLRNSHTLPRILMLEMQKSLKHSDFKFSKYSMEYILTRVSEILKKSHEFGNNRQLFQIYYIAFHDYWQRFYFSSEKEKMHALKIIVNLWFVTFLTPIIVKKDKQLAKDLQSLFSTDKGSWTTIAVNDQQENARDEIVGDFSILFEKIRYSYY